MVSRKPDVFPLSTICLLVLALLLVLPPAPLYSAIAPEREIVPLDSPDVPAWKRYWDRGRELARLGKYQYAAEYYKELILLKPQIEEAKWEYCRILFRLEEYEEASPLLESLIEANPYRKDYIKLAGKVALELGEYKKAAYYLGQSYSLMPQGTEGEELLSDFIEALEGQGRNEEAYVMLEQLRQRKSQDRQLLERLARKSKALEKRSKALEYYSLLAEEAGGNIELLSESADIFAEYGEEQKALPLWKEVVAVNPRAISYHQNIAEYYLNRGEGNEALPHVLAVIEYDKRFDPKLLLTVARIYARDSDRPDLSLQYFERYLKLFPKNNQAQQELFAAREEIADALLALVENNGARLLWNDLAKFTDDRLSIFHIMAARLEPAGTTDALIDVLEVIEENSTDDDEIRFKLSGLYADRGDDETAYRYLMKISEDWSSRAGYCLARGTLEEQIGLDSEALDSYICALKADQEDLEIRGAAIELAGDLGKLDYLLELGRPLVSAPILNSELQLYLAYLKGLRQNGSYSAAEELYTRMFSVQWTEATAYEQISLSKAETLRHMGRLFASQRILREMMAADKKSQDAIIQLIHSAADSDSVGDGWSLFWYLVKNLDRESWRLPDDRSLAEVFLTYIYLLEKEGSYNLAIGDLENYLKRLPSDWREGNGKPISDILNFKLCDLYLAVGRNDSCGAVLGKYAGKMMHNPDVWVARKFYEGNGSLDAVDLEHLSEPSAGLRGLFSAYERAGSNGENHAAMKIADLILGVEPGSRRAQILRARAAAKTGDYGDAAEAFRKLHQLGGDDGIFLTEYLALEFRRGRYDFIIDELTAKEFDTLPVEQKLLLARTLWAMGELKQSLVTYRQLLTPKVDSQFKQRLADKHLKFDWEEGGEVLFWSMFSHEGPEQLDRLNALRSDDGFLAIAGTPVGKIVAELYDSYRWEKLAKNEYQIREAVEDKNYIIAERQNRARLNEEQSVEGLKDLAKVYERLGNYTKEAEVYAYLQARGETLPELQELMERNRLARAPTFAGDTMYSERNGRDGAVDIQQNYYGANFKYLAGLRKEFQVEYGELQYKPESGGKSIDGRSFGGKARFELTKDTTLRLEGGFHLLESDADSLGVYAIKLDHEFDPILSGYVEFREDPVDDTIEALTQGIYSRTLMGGLVIDGATGVSIGGEYQHKWFKGQNEQDGMQFWSSYTFFSDYTSLGLKYSYELLKSSESNLIDPDDSFGTDTGSGNFEDIPYWSPGSYWQHELSFSFRHLLKDFDTFENTPSYYLVDFAIGYEADGNVRYTGAFDIFLEMSEHFLLKGEVLYSRSDNYNEKTAAMSLMYRW